MAPELPDWIREGERVAVYEGFRLGGRYSTDVIERITATQVVLVSGRRFRRAGLHEVATGRGELRDRCDAGFREWRIGQEIEEYARKVHEIALELRNNIRMRPDEALSQLGAAQREMEKAIYRINEGRI